MFHGNLLGPTDGISFIYLSPDHAVCSTFSPLAVTTAPTAILIMSWCATPPHKETRPSRHKHCKYFWLSVSANSSASYRKPSRTPRVRMPPPGGTSWGRPSTLRPCRLSAEWTGLVTAGSTPAYRSWSPSLSQTTNPLKIHKEPMWESADSTPRCTQFNSEHCQTLCQWILA